MQRRSHVRLNAIRAIMASSHAFFQSLERAGRRWILLTRLAVCYNGVAREKQLKSCTRYYEALSHFAARSIPCRWLCRLTTIKACFMGNLYETWLLYQLFWCPMKKMRMKNFHQTFTVYIGSKVAAHFVIGLIRLKQIDELIGTLSNPVIIALQAVKVIYETLHTVNRSLRITVNHFIQASLQTWNCVAELQGRLSHLFRPYYRVAWLPSRPSFHEFQMRKC